MTVRLPVNSVPGSRLQEKTPKSLNALYRCVLVYLLATFRLLAPLYDNAILWFLFEESVVYYGEPNKKTTL